MRGGFGVGGGDKTDAALLKMEKSVCFHLAVLTRGEGVKQMPSYLKWKKISFVSI